MKALFFGLLLASPAVAVWRIHGGESSTSRPEVRRISNTTRPETTVRVPVEVMAKGSPPEWIYIEVAGQALPKPDSFRDLR